jgi:hypothetical protein
MNKVDGKPQTKFSDVTDATPHAAAIRLVAERGWLKGQADGTFRPNAPMARVEVVVAVNQMLQRHCAAPPDRAQAFKDVPKSYWADDEIREASTTHAVQSEELKP